MIITKPLKERAIFLRKRGWSYPQIMRRLSVPRSTLSGWFQKLVLPIEAQNRIRNRKKENLSRLREKAVLTKQRQREYAAARNQEQIEQTLKSTWIDPTHQELVLTMLYMGEGCKNRSAVGLGNSNPHILKLFLKLLNNIYRTDPKKLRCYLYLRADQNENREKKFWSQQLSIPTTQFNKTHFDKRTLQSKTREHYHGVCLIYYYDARIGKRIAAIEKILLETHFIATAN